MNFWKRILAGETPSPEEAEKRKEEKEIAKQIKLKNMQEKLERMQKDVQDRQERAKFTKRINLIHLAGYPKIKAGKNVLITKAQGANQVKLGTNVVTVKAIDWSEKGKRSAGKAATGAIIGGALTGGVGLIAGAALGGRKKDDSVVTLIVSENEIDYTVYFRASQQEYQELASIL